MRKHYLPNDDNGRLAWLINFNSKLGTYSATFGIAAGEVTAVAAFLVMLQYMLDLIDSVRTFSQDLTKYKDKLMVAPLGSTLGAVPTMTIAAAPPTVPAGIFTIISGIVKRIKANAAYTEAIGEDLGIIGADIIEDFGSMKPALNISLNVGNPRIKYVKQRTDGINLYADHDDGRGMRLLRFVTQNEFTDTTPISMTAMSAVYKYMGIYVVDDAEVGIPSDPVTITVRKIV